MKDEPIPVSNHSPFPADSFTPHPWAQSEHTLIPVADSCGPGGGLPAGDNPLGRSAMKLEPNDLITSGEGE